MAHEQAIAMLQRSRNEATTTLKKADENVVELTETLLKSRRKKWMLEDRIRNLKSSIRHLGGDPDGNP